MKQRLRDNTSWAAGLGVFGVPTLVVDGEMFWGQDGLDMGLDYLAHPDAFADADMRRADALPVGASRLKS